MRVAEAEGKIPVASIRGILGVMFRHRWISPRYARPQTAGCPTTASQESLGPAHQHLAVSI